MGINRYKRSKQGGEASVSSSQLVDSESGLYVENVGLTDIRVVNKVKIPLSQCQALFYLELYNQ